MSAIYRRIPHAAHYAYSHPAMGHDLEEWDITDSGTIVPHRVDGVPEDAHYSHGYVRDGVQHWIYTRRAPLSPGQCDRCAER